MSVGPTPLDDFWESSALSAATISTFAARVDAYQPPTAGTATLVGPGALQPLTLVDDRFQRLLAARHSIRTFGDDPLDERAVTRLLAATGPRPGGRTVPEAGDLDAVHTFAIGRRTGGPFRGRIVRYDHVAHAVATVGACPGDDELRRLFSIDAGADLPQLVLIFVVDDGEARAKYGERAGRFVLQQVGHAAQNVGLRLARDDLRGYLLGGGLDREILGALGLAHTRARFGGAMACGR